MTALTAACALLISGLSLKATKDGQITSRYSSAVEQLGGGNLETKIGAIYALGRLAVDSEYDRPAVTSLLTDYVRAKAVKEVTPPDVPHSCRFGGATPLDVIAALRVMFYDLARKRRGRPIDLNRVCLNEVELPAADLSCVILDNAVIYNSGLERANLADASLQNAFLNGSRFMRADFSRSNLEGAELGDGSATVSAGMDGARLGGANLSGAALIGVQFPGADLTNARLTGADLARSNLTGARLRTYVGDARRLPPGTDLSGALAGPLPEPPDQPAAESGRTCG